MGNENKVKIYKQTKQTKKRGDNMQPKVLGGIQVIGGLIAGYFGWGDWAIVVLALLFIIMGIHHFTEKK